MRSRRSFAWLFVFTIIALLTPGLSAQRVTSTISTVSATLTGQDPRAVAVNPITNKIYVANWQSANVTVIDGATDTVDGEVPVGSFPIAIAVNPNNNRIYVASQGTGEVW